MQFAEYFGPEREVAVCREISKLHEETMRGTLTEVIAHFTATEPRGEIVIILGGSGLPQPLPKRGDSEEDGKENSLRKRKKND
jgi:16S rRNA C1402 (ribose-2'-O) methylase RsmI